MQVTHEPNRPKEQRASEVPSSVRVSAQSTRLLVWTLRGMGTVDLMALIAVVMPIEWMQRAHVWIGLGELPTGPIVSYLARSSSVLYAMHGALVLFLSSDVRRYWPLIRFLAVSAVVHGVVVWGIDFSAGMPNWWTTVEGPSFALTGLIVLLQRPPSDAG